MGILQGLSKDGNGLYAAWKGETNDDRLFYASFDGQQWTDKGTIPGESSVGPSLALLNGTLYAAWRGKLGETNDQRLFWSYFDGQQWQPQAQIPGASSTGPILGVLHGKLYAVWKGEDNDNGLYWSQLNGGTWTGQSPVSGASSLYGPSLADFNGKLWAAWRGGYNDQGIYYASFDGMTWKIVGTINGSLSSVGPSLAVYGGRLYVAWKGEIPDQGLYYGSFDESMNWSGQNPIPNASSSSGPALEQFGAAPGNLYAMWKGPGLDQQIFYASFDGQSWSSASGNLLTLPGNTGQDVAPTPEGGLAGSSNYLLTNNCHPILGLTVTIDVTEDIVFQSEVNAGQGFSFQLNAYGPTGAVFAWQQFNFGIDTSGGSSATIQGSVEMWAVSLPDGSDLVNTNGINIVTVNDGPKLPKGYQLQLVLHYGSGGVVDAATFNVTPPSGGPPKQLPIDITKLTLDSSLNNPPTDPQFQAGAPVKLSYLAPIIAFQLNFVAINGGGTATLSSGQAVVTYTASTPLTALNYIPACAATQASTAENANTTYSGLSATPSTIMLQTLNVVN